MNFLSHQIAWTQASNNLVLTHALCYLNDSWSNIFSHSWNFFVSCPLLFCSIYYLFIQQNLSNSHLLYCFHCLLCFCIIFSSKSMHVYTMHFHKKINIILFSSMFQLSVISWYFFNILWLLFVFTKLCFTHNHISHITHVSCGTVTCVFTIIVTLITVFSLISTHAHFLSFL